MNENIIVVEKVYKIFKGTTETVALDGISINFNTNEFVAVYGPSGSGKTTLLKCLGNIWKPTTGKIFYNNKEINKFKENQSSEYRIHDIGFIFQDFNLIPSLTVSENIELPLVLAKIKDKKQRKEKVISLLEEFGIERYKDSYPNELSSGEQQRIAIAIALVNKPKIILADEPTANLDMENRSIILNHLKRLSEQDILIIVATHDNEIRKYADRILQIDKGKLLN